MPIVPTYERQSRAEMAPVNQVDIRVPQTGAGEALAQVGGNYLQAIGQEKQKQDLADMQDKLNQFSVYADDLYNNPQNGLITLQGKNAIGQGEAFAGQISAKATELRDSIPEYMRQAFDQQIQPLGRSYGNRARQYEVGQKQQYESGQYQGVLDNLQQQESESYNNPQEVTLIKQSRVNTIIQYGQSHGWSPEQMAAELHKYNNQALEKRAQNYAVSNPDGWLNGDFMSADSGGMDMRAIAIVESGGKHINADGSVVTSSEGAQGRFQLMPATGKELAAKRGVRYDPKDEQQNALLASDYANELYGKYGSETLAGAAYNWGQGRVDKLIDKIGDPRKGEVSETEFIRNLPAETRGWLARYRKNKTGLDPVSVNKIDNMAEAQIREQRVAVRNQIDPILNNTMSQLYNGEVPDAMPDRATIQFAYGQQGEGMVKQLGIAIDSARTFQAIQYISPAQQQQELSKVKPQVNDPDYAIKMDAYGKLAALVQKSNTAIQAQRDASRFNDAILMGEKLDPTDKAMQKAADATRAAQNFRINDASTHDDVVQQVAQTGIIPDKVTTQLTAISRAKSPEVVKQGAELFSRLYDTDPASVGDMPKEMQGFYMTVKQLTDSGMAPDAAIEQAQNVTYNQTDALKAQLASEQGTAAYKKERGKAIGSAASSMAQWFRWDPSADDQTPDAARFRNDYQTLYDLNYRTAGGNADVAKKMTNQQIARTWSISEVNGNAQFMKYAPEALHNYGPSGWQAAQWKEDKLQLMYGDRTESIETSGASLGITSGRTAFVETKTPKSKVGGELEIAADVSTPRTGDYAIMVRTKDKDGIESVQPYYDKYGRSMRWKPSLQDWEPYQKMQKEREDKNQEEISKGQEIRDFKAKHRALDEMYKRLHDERVNRQKQYFSWSAE
ncbi:transglycosylase SLT domain-containing protein [Serratia marcescens]|uniref:transglycosylase SLT domain-containing protein n=1 Tax=Serratia marcescens TaxID=615 RepID=UPI001D151A68|nr:transglycosylase SLT domain-containing protein [Serratia marcescens]MCX2170654.1 transglycosylase SLT domain-containing protein [Serratia marcescens]MCX2176888.1 transglycosylase SLT domain-containing protein [Serratia marcescens]